MKPNYIVIWLCDNDYGQELDQTAKLISDQFYEPEILISERRMAEIAVDLIMALCNLRDGYRGFETASGLNRKHLEKKLKVTFQNHPPTEDHDSGSVAIDRTRNYIWRF